MDTPLHSLPHDPGHELYLKTCYVCQELAKPGQEHIRNYGGIVCFSCRQFFRRAHQKTKQPNFNCTFGGNCAITVKSRRRCQKCRYERCIFAGMVPAAVLTDEEKTVRFRKFRQKKKAKTLASEPKQERTRKRRSGTSRDSSETSNDENDDPQAVPTTSKRARTEPVAHSYPPPRRPTCTLNLAAPRPPESNEPARPWPTLMASKIDQIVQRYQMTLTQMQSELSEVLFFKLEAIQSGDITVTFSKSEIFEHLAQVSKQFHHFALLQSQFTKLRKRDQRHLLSRNTPLYIQLYLSFYFSTPKGSQLLEHIQGSNSHQFDRNCLVFIQWFNAINAIFKSGANINEYAQLFATLNALRLSCSKVRAVLAYIILFDFDPKMNITDSFILEDISILNEIMFMSCLKKHRENHGVENLIAVLSQMAVFGSNNIEWKEENSISLRNSEVVSCLILTKNYTRDEERWLQYQICRIESATHSVTHTEERLKEFLTFSVGVQPTSSFMVESFRVFQERIWRILSAHSEFTSLTDCRKKSIWNRSAPIGVAFLLMKKECAERGIDQLREEYGGIPEGHFENLFRALFGAPGKMKRMWYQKSFLQQLEIGLNKLSIRNVLENQNDLHSRQLVDTCSRVETDLTSSLSDPVLEKILLMLSITQPCQESLPQLHGSYLKLLWRHLSVRENGISFWKNCDVKVQFSETIQSLNGLKEIAALIENMF